jgi:xanthine dehydrogenase accessory factor
MNQLLKDILDLLEDEPLVLATVVSHGGSAPRGAGARMAVRADGSIVGTVGGGLLEAQAMERAAKLLAEPAGRAEFMDFTLSNELAAGSDMICGGRVRLLLEHVAPGDEGARALADAADLLRRGRAAALCGVVAGDPARVLARSALALDDPDASSALDEDVRAALDIAQAGGAPALAEGGGRTALAEPFLPAPGLFILGAGHVSRPTAAMAAMAGFRTVVLDDRADFANRERFPDADEVAVLPGFDDVFDGRAPDARSSVVIVTRGHLHDRTVLAQALRTDAGYVGMIGSRRKRDAIYESLLADGFTRSDIDRCHCPIGLPIGAQTPEEIAVSIVAQLVGWRAGALG